MIKQWVLFATLLSLSSCTSINNNDYYYDEIVIRNTTTSNVTDAVLSIREGGGIFSCSFIPPRGTCSSKFPKRKFLGNPVSVKWSINGAKMSTKEFFVTVPPGADHMIPLRGVLDILDTGKIRPHLEQNAGKY